MPGHDLKHLEGLLRATSDGSDELLQLIYMKGYTTPREFALVTGAVEAIAAQMKNVVAVSREIIGAHANVG
jgi:hypothetical protein